MHADVIIMSHVISLRRWEGMSWVLSRGLDGVRAVVVHSVASEVEIEISFHSRYAAMN